VNLKKKI